jgi:hypothetical protein
MTVIAFSFLVYMVAIIAFGVYTARFARDTSDDFFLAGRTLGAWVAAFSSSASAESGWVTMALLVLGGAEPEAAQDATPAPEAWVLPDPPPEACADRENELEKAYLPYLVPLPTNDLKE